MEWAEVTGTPPFFSISGGALQGRCLCFLFVMVAGKLSCGELIVLSI